MIRDWKNPTCDKCGKACADSHFVGYATNGKPETTVHCWDCWQADPELQKAQYAGTPINLGQFEEQIIQLGAVDHVRIHPRDIEGLKESGVTMGVGATELYGLFLWADRSCKVGVLSL